MQPGGDQEETGFVVNGRWVTLYNGKGPGLEERQGTVAMNEALERPLLIL